MKNTETLKVTTPRDREVAMARVFDAPRRVLYEAWTKPDLLKRWLYGPEDWPLAVCEIDLRVGARLRFVWRHRGGDGKDMGMSGVYRETLSPDRLLVTEVFDSFWTGGTGAVTMTYT